MRTKRKATLRRRMTFLVVVYITTMITFALTMFDDVNRPDDFGLIWMLPAVFFLVNLCSQSIIMEISRNLVLFIVWAGYFSRFVLTVLLLHISDYYFPLSFMSYEKHIGNAIILMSYEIIIVFVSLEVYLKVHIKEKTQNQLPLIFNITAKHGRSVTVFLLLAIIFCAITFSIVPKALATYSTIFSDKIQIATIDPSMEIVGARGTIARSFAVFAGYVLNILVYLVPAYLLVIVFQKLRSVRGKLVISVLVSLVPLFIITESNIQPFIAITLNILMISRLYSIKANKSIAVLLLLAITSIISIVVAKFVLTNLWVGGGTKIIGAFANAYFPGVINVAASYNLVEYENRIRTLLYDVISTVPFKNSIFPTLSTQAITLTELFNWETGTLGQINPLIGAARYYLGPFLAPILPTMIAITALKIRERAVAADYYWRYFSFMFLSIRLCMIPSQYTHTSILSVLTYGFIPIYVVTVLIPESIGGVSNKEIRRPAIYY